MGPYSWPGYEHENGLPRIPRCSGVYLQTVEYQDGYLIYAAGITRRSLPIRFREHDRNYRNGEYNVLDIDEMQRGVRKEFWHGWGWTPEKRLEFQKQKPIILAAVRKQLAGFRIFVADIGTRPRLLERLEASIMSTLYSHRSPMCDVPARGMKLAPKWKSEKPIVVNNLCSAILHGIPSTLEI